MEIPWLLIDTANPFGGRTTFCPRVSLLVDVDDLRADFGANPEPIAAYSVVTTVSTRWIWSVNHGIVPRTLVKARRSGYVGNFGTGS